MAYGVVVVSNIPVEKIDEFLRKDLDGYDKYDTITIRTEIGELDVIKGQAKRFICVVSGGDFEELEPVVTLLVGGKDVRKLDTLALSSEFNSRLMSQVFKGKIPSFEVAEVIEFTENEFLSALKQAVNLFLKTPAREIVRREIITSYTYENVEEEEHESGKSSSLLIERSGTLSMFISEKDDERSYF